MILAKQKITIKKTTKKKYPKTGKGQKRCPTCGRYR